MENSDLTGKRVAVLGFDIEGKTSYEYYRGLGAEVTICDQKADLETPAGAPTQLGPTYLDGLDRFDIIVRTAGLIPSKVLAVNPPAVAGKITTQINEFLRVCPTRNVIGVTGTKGKGTTSTLITKILQAAGHDTYLGGNIGIAPFTFLGELTPESWVVLELSSFQLTDVQRSPHIAVCLMVAPEHLNWHADMAEYKLAKSQLFAWQSSDDVAIYFDGSDTSREIAEAGAGRKLPFYRSPGAFVNGNMVTIDGLEVCTTDELKLLGQHNRQNVCAAVTAVWEAGVRDIAAIRSVLTTFAGLPHRLEKVRELDGITFYNDSFAATPDAAVAAVSAIPGKKVMIFGGFDRLLPLENFARDVQKQAETITKALLIGQSSERTSQALATAGFTNFEISTAQTMPEIVEQAHKLASGSGAVVLSPGFASFDMFKNFEDRGNQYKAAVEAL